MTKQEKKIAAQAIVMLEELRITTRKQHIKAEAQRLIQLLAQAIED